MSEVSIGMVVAVGPHTHTYSVKTPDEVARAMQVMLNHLPAEERRQARALLIRRLRHPELGGEPQAAPDAHPVSTGRTWSTSQSALCVCGTTRSQHDIDGLRDDCDGYAPLPG